MARATVLHDPQSARVDLFRHVMFKQDHAIGDVFLQALPGQRAVAALPGYDHRDVLGLEPAEQSAQLRPQDGLVG